MWWKQCPLSQMYHLWSLLGFLCIFLDCCFHCFIGIYHKYCNILNEICSPQMKSYCFNMLYLFVSQITVNLFMQWYIFITYIHYMVLIWLHTLLYFTLPVSLKTETHAWYWFGHTVCYIFNYILTIIKQNRS